jgi:hypothetical protein
MAKLSPSSINLMIDCPRCFWLQLVKKIRRTKGYLAPESKEYSEESK